MTVLSICKNKVAEPCMCREVCQQFLSLFPFFSLSLIPPGMSLPCPSFFLFFLFLTWIHSPFPIVVLNSMLLHKSPPVLACLLWQVFIILYWDGVGCYFTIREGYNAAGSLISPRVFEKVPSGCGGKFLSFCRLSCFICYVIPFYVLLIFSAKLSFPISIFSSLSGWVAFVISLTILFLIFHWLSDGPAGV